MPDDNNGQKEIQELQKRILGLEDTITKLKEKPNPSDDSKARIEQLEKDLELVRQEKAELQSKIWDHKTERRQKGSRRTSERRAIKEHAPAKDESWAGGHFG